MGKKRQVIDAVIVGAGPAGLVSALLAKRLGLSVHVIERHGPENYHGHAHYLNAQSLDILARAGLDMHCFKHRCTSSEQEMSMSYGTTVQSIFERIHLFDDPQFDTMHKHLGPFGSGVNVGYHAWRKSLLDAVEKHDIPVLWNHHLEKVDSARQTVTARSSINTHSEKVLAYRWLCACDGAHSEVAKQFGVRYQEPATVWQRFLSVETRGDLRPYLAEPSMMFWIYQPFVSACLVVHDIETLQVWQIPIYTHAEHAVIEDEQIHIWLQSLLGIEDDAYQALDYRISSKGQWGMHTHVLSEMQIGEHVFFVGDSAHAMTPAGGLGLNTALADADNLMWKLALEKQHAGRGDLLSFANERYQHGLDRMRYSIEHYKTFLNIPHALGLSESLAPCGSAVAMLGWNIAQSVRNHADQSASNTHTGFFDWINQGALSLAAISQPGALSTKALAAYIRGMKNINDSLHPLLPSYTDALRSTQRYFFAIYAHLAYHYGGGLWNQRNSSSASWHVGTSCFPTQEGCWVGYLQIVLSDGQTPFITEYHNASGWLIVVFDEAYLAHAENTLKADDQHLQAQVLLAHNRSFAYTPWCKVAKYVIIRPDRIVHCVERNVSA